MLMFDILNYIEPQIDFSNKVLMCDNVNEGKLISKQLQNIFSERRRIPRTESTITRSFGDLWESEHYACYLPHDQFGKFALEVL